MMKYYLFLWMTLVLDAVKCSSCPAFYKRVSEDHTYCKTSTCNVIQQGITEDDKKKILKIHNDLRSKLATGKETEYQTLPSAANMVQMEWDDELAAVAQKHANLCKFEHDRGDQRAVENFGAGQNLLIYYGTLDFNWDGIASWYTSEVKYFHPQYIKPFVFGFNYGHFTQVIWAKSWKVGCGVASFNDGQKKVLYTCNYGPAGNMMDGTAYIEGSPCSKCPRNTQCSNEYEGLCKSITPDGPQREPPSIANFPLYCDFTDQQSQQCKNIKIDSTVPLETKKIYTGMYKTTLLKPGDKITLKLGTFQHNEGICPFIIGRLGPNEAGQRAGAYADIKFSSPGILFPPIQLKNSYSSWSTIGILMNFDGEMEVSLNVGVDPGSPLQYIDIQAFGISGGKCPSI